MRPNSLRAYAGRVCLMPGLLAGFLLLCLSHLANAELVKQSGSVAQVVGARAELVEPWTFIFRRIAQDERKTNT